MSDAFCKGGGPVAVLTLRASLGEQVRTSEFQLVQETRPVSMLRMYRACALAHTALVAAGSFACWTALAIASVALCGSVAFARWAVLHVCVCVVDRIERAEVNSRGRCGAVGRSRMNKR